MGNALIHGKQLGAGPGDGRMPIAVDSFGNLIMSNGTPAFINFAATTTPTALTAAACRFVEIKNTTGVDVVVDHGPGTATFTVPTGNDKVFHTAANSNELRVSVAAGAATLDMEVWG